MDYSDTSGNRYGNSDGNDNANGGTSRIQKTLLDFADDDRMARLTGQERREFQQFIDMEMQRKMLQDREFNSSPFLFLTLPFGKN